MPYSAQWKKRLLSRGVKAENRFQCAKLHFRLNSEVTQFLANCEVEAHLSLHEGLKVLRYAHPANNYTVFLRDLRVEPASDPPLLSVQIVFAAAALHEARDLAERYLKEFLDYLVVVTNCKFRLRRILHIFNWEPGSGMRECMYYVGASNHEVPVPGLAADLLDTLALLQQHPVQPRLRRALKWFGNGVSAIYRDDQFTYFWFVIEVLAQVVKSVAPVPDKCPMCGGPLFCQACGVSHVHRPYPKQAIQHLFAKYVAGEPDAFFERTNKIRNALLHGDEIAAIESDLRIDFSEEVNKLGHLAWTALMGQFAPSLVGKQIAILQTNRYVHVGLTVGAHMQVGFIPKFDDPTPDHFPDVKIKMTHTRTRKGTGETSTS